MFSALNLTPNLLEADHFYEALIDAHRGLTESESAAFNARLILILANHVGRLDVLLEALQASASSRSESSTSASPDG